MDQTAIFAPILKADKQSDGTLMVSGIATDSSLDTDQQRCDPEWLKSAMPKWFRWGNVREGHGPVAAGVATEYTEKDGAHHIVAHIVDPVSVKKIETGVLKGFSIGIRNPRIRTSQDAPGGIISDGVICEISVVDRPANEVCKLTLAKSARPGMKGIHPDDVDGNLVRVEELTEKSADADAIPEPEAPTDSAVSDAAAGITGEGVPAAAEGAAVTTPEDAPVAPEDAPDAPAEPEPAPEAAAPADAPVEDAVKAAGVDVAAVAAQVAEILAARAEKAATPAPAPVTQPDLTPDVVEFFQSRAAALGVEWPTLDKSAAHDPTFLATVRNGILACLIGEAREAMRGGDEVIDMGMLLRSLSTFLAWWNCEAVAGEVPASVDVAGPDLSLATVVENPTTGAVDLIDCDDSPVADSLRVPQDAPPVRSAVTGDAALNGLDSIVGDMDLAGGVVVERPKGAEPELTKSADAETGCGCCDKCQHSPAAEKSATPDAPADAPVEAPAVEAEPAADVPAAPVEKSATPEPAADAPADETPAEADGPTAGDSTTSKTAAPDTVKAAVAEAVNAALQEARADAQAEIDALKARLAQVEKAAAPGGPARRATTQTAPALEKSAALVALEYRRAQEFETARGLEGTDRRMAAEFDRRVSDLDKQIAVLKAAQASTPTL